MKKKLLTPKDVAELLNISARTVYDNARALGGFYPAGICVLRFDPDDLNDILERSKMGALALRVPVSLGELRRKRPCKKGKAPAGKQGPIKTNPARHGL